MPTVLLIRHGRTSANAAGVLAGRTPGVHLDETGRTQADRVAARLAEVRLAALVSSPLERCVETAEAIATAQRPDARRSTPSVGVTIDDGLVECGYGDWTGRPLRDLARTTLWRQVQVQPSAVTFPKGESMQAAQARAVAAVRTMDAAVAETSGPHVVWAAISHGDIIKSIIADALGLHLDLFQRLVVDPASVTTIRYGPDRPFVVRMNDTGSDLSGLATGRRRRPHRDAVVGGGTGNHETGTE